MKHLFLKVTVLFFITITISCINKDDPEDQLPPITQTGANTFGCIINGKVLIPKDGIGVPQPKGLFVTHRINNNLIICLLLTVLPNRHHQIHLLQGYNPPHYRDGCNILYIKSGVCDVSH